MASISELLVGLARKMNPDRDTSQVQTINDCFMAIGNVIEGEEPEEGQIIIPTSQLPARARNTNFDSMTDDSVTYVNGGLRFQDTDGDNHTILVHKILKPASWNPSQTVIDGLEVSVDDVVIYKKKNYNAGSGNNYCWLIPLMISQSEGQAMKAVVLGYVFDHSELGAQDGIWDEFLMEYQSSYNGTPGDVTGIRVGSKNDVSIAITGNQAVATVDTVDYSYSVTRFISSEGDYVLSQSPMISDSSDVLLIGYSFTSVNPTSMGYFDSLRVSYMMGYGDIATLPSDTEVLRADGGSGDSNVTTPYDFVSSDAVADDKDMENAYRLKSLAVSSVWRENGTENTVTDE